jgi:hypothetical protein
MMRLSGGCVSHFELDQWIKITHQFPFSPNWVMSHYSGKNTTILLVGKLFQRACPPEELL